MSPFPSQIILCVILLLTVISVSCEDPPRPALAATSLTEQPVAQPTEPVLTLKIENVQEIELDPTLIVGHSNVDTEALLGVISDDSEEAACKTAGGFLVVPLLPAEGTYYNCGDKHDTVYVMKLINCTKETISFAKFKFTITLPSVQGDIVESKLIDEHTDFKLYFDKDGSNYLSAFDSVDEKTGTVPFGVVVEVEAGEEQFSRLNITRQCSDNGDPLEFNLDLTGALASKGTDEAKYIDGAVFEKPDRQVVLRSRD